MRAGLSTGKFVVADHEVSRAIDRARCAFPVHYLHVGAGELDRRLASDAAFYVFDVRQDREQLLLFGFFDWQRDLLVRDFFGRQRAFARTFAA